MDYKQLVDTMTPEVFQNLKRSVELGKWPDGKQLTPEQRQNAMQAIILWGEMHLEPEQRVGFIDKGHKSGDVCDDTAAIPLAWKDKPRG